MIRGGVPITHTTTCIIVTIIPSNQLSKFSLPKRNCRWSSMSALYFVNLFPSTLFLYHWFLVLFAQTSVEFPVLSVGHLFVLHDFCWLLWSILCNRLNWIHVTLEKVVSYSQLLHYCIKDHKVKINIPTRSEYSQVAIQHAHSPNGSIEVQKEQALIRESVLNYS